MASPKRNTAFFLTEEGQAIEKTLVQMAEDIKYNTESSYAANGDTYPGHVMSFVQKHKDYLIRNSSTDPVHYLANLRLKTRRNVVY